MSRRPHSLARALATLVCAALPWVPAAARADTCAGLRLTGLTPAAAGAEPVAVAVGDFDKDGKLDVATANNLGHDVSIVLGDGSGGFGDPRSVGSWPSSNPIDVAAGDLDRDGYLDLVVASGSRTEARVLQGLEGGAFSAVANPLDVGVVPTRLHLADFTRDGTLDLVVVSRSENKVVLLEGTGDRTFSTILATIGGPHEGPVAAVAGDFNRDGYPDLAVAFESSRSVAIYYRDAVAPAPFAWVEGPSLTLGASGPRDLTAGDFDRDGWLDLITADFGSGGASALRNDAGSSLVETKLTVAGTPSRAALVDLDHDAFLDLVLLDDAGPRLVGLLGLTTGPPYFQESPLYEETLPGASASGLAVGRFTKDGRADLVTALPGAGQLVVVQNQSGTPCAGTSFARAPRGYAAGDGPSSTAAADLDGDGRADLAVAAQNSRKLWLLRNVGGHFAEFQPSTSVDVSPATPTAVASGDLNADGRPDVVATLDGTNLVQVFLGNGVGGLTPGPARGIGAGPAAVVIGDFDGNGIPDVTAASQSTGTVLVYLGDGLGGLAAGLSTAVGTGPSALVAGFFDAGTTLDLAVANSTGNSVSVLLGDGDGTFTEAAGSPVLLGPSTEPRGIAAGDVDGDQHLDLVTANYGSASVSVLLNNGAGGFTLQATPYAVPPNPTAAALLDLGGDSALDLVVTAAGNRSLVVLTNDKGVFKSPRQYPVRNFPRAITPVDVDSDGALDLVVPCQTADAVAVLLARPPGTPSLLEALRVVAGDTPHALVSVDLDRDGDLDLAVAATGNDRVTLHWNDGKGAFSADPTDFVTVGQDPESIVAADFNRDGRIDLALNGPGATPAPVVTILLASGADGEFTPQLVSLPGLVPDDLAVADLDDDGDLDIAVCDKQLAGSVQILGNDGTGLFSPGVRIADVGGKPTAIVAVDVDRDGDVDLAVANESSNDVRVLVNDRTGGFSRGPSLPVATPDTSPFSLAAGDLDGDGAPELVAAVSFGDRVHVYANQGGGQFGTSLPIVVPVTLQSVTLADLNRDGELDLTAVAAGLVALRGGEALAFEPPETWLAGVLPWAASIGDFNRDGRPDAAVANAGSNDVSVLLSSTCLARRLDVALQPLACGLGSVGDVIVEVRDDGGNLAQCATGVVKPSIAPGTGADGADLLPDLVEASGLAVSSGVAAFTAASSSALTIDRPGRRYRLQFLLDDTPPPDLPVALSRTFTHADDTIEILGPASFCAPGSASYQIADAPGRWDSYGWMLDAPPPIAFTPGVLLANPAHPRVTLGAHTLNLTTRVDACSVTAPPRSLYVGDLQSVTLDPPSGVLSSVCLNCIGGTKKAIELGGGAATRQWGYRTTTGGAVTSLPGETGETYTLKGASFPGPGTYYVVVTSTSACVPATQRVSNEWLVTVTEGEPNGEVGHLAAVSSGNGTTGQNILQWVNSTGSAEETLIRWDQAAPGTTDCLPPASTSAPADGEAVLPSTADPKSTFPHSALQLNTAYCYSVFVKVGGVYSPGRTVKARPFDATPQPGRSVKWAYATGGTAVAPPSVGTLGILAVSNDRTVHALTPATGTWPGPWMPRSLVGVAHSRSSVVPFAPPLALANSLLFVADDAGYVHAVNEETGQLAWAEDQGMPITGAPAGMFVHYGGSRNLLFLGTRMSSSPNELRALAVDTGALVDAYAGGVTEGQIGPISGMPSIDYAATPLPRVCFASRRHAGSGRTLWCLNIQPSGPVFSHTWSLDLGDITGSPVIRNGRIYVGTEAGVIYGVDTDGTNLRSFTPTPADGPVKGFLFPDRRVGSDDLVFATNTKVWSISDGASMTKNWEWTPGGASPNPSIVLQRPGTSFVYVGSANGELYELDFTNAGPGPPTAKMQTLGAGVGQVGAPSLHNGLTPLLLVGSEPGVLYAVEVPFQ